MKNKRVLIFILAGVFILLLVAGVYFLITNIKDLKNCGENPEACREWCEENPKLCSLLMGGFRISGVADPPDTEIIFAKAVNLISRQFTEEDIVKAKELGANMITLWPARIVSNDEIIFFTGDLPGMIDTAHKNVLQVELRSSFGGGAAEDYEKFKTGAITHVAEYAKFAEKNKVYRIVPFGEIDNDLINHCEKITEFSQEILQEMRKYYSGKIGIGVVGSWRDCGYNFNGYDYLTVSVYPQTQTSVEAWLSGKSEINLITTVDWAREVAERSNISILHIGETGVQNIGESDPLGFFQTAEVTLEEEAEFYNKLFEGVSGKVDGISVFYNSKTSFLGVNGQPAEETIKKWYTERF